MAKITGQELSLLTVNGSTLQSVTTSDVVPEDGTVSRCALTTSNTVQWKSPDDISADEDTFTTFDDNPSNTLTLGATAGSFTDKFSGEICSVVILKEPTATQVQLVEYYLNRYYLGLDVIQSLPGLAAHLDAANPSNTLSGSNFVTTLADDSGWGNNLVGGPMILSDINGRTALDGDGYSGFTRASLTQGTLPQPTTQIVVAQTPPVSGSQILTDGVGGRNIIRHFGATEPALYAGSNVGTGISAPLNEPVIYRAEFNGASSSINAQFQFAAEQDATLNAGTLSLAGFAISSTWDGRIGELAVIDQLLCDELKDIVDKYLKSKWRI